LTGLGFIDNLIKFWFLKLNSRRYSVLDNSPKRAPVSINNLRENDQLVIDLGLQMFWVFCGDNGGVLDWEEFKDSYQAFLNFFSNKREDEIELAINELIAKNGLEAVIAQREDNHFLFLVRKKQPN
jgi:hypothetical protein